ncbi:MAG: metallophosphoesterase [Myxococcota bacterium]
MIRPLAITLALWAITCLHGCISGPEDRAALDEEVGRAVASGVQVRVKEGHAVVRSLAADALSLWSSVPLFEAELSLESDTDFTIVVDNALPDAGLRVITETGATPDVDARTGERATQRIFEVALPTGASRLVLETADRDERAPYRIALMSDIQEAVDDVQDLFDAIEVEPNIRFLLGAGDLASNGTRDELVRIQRELHQFDLPYYTTLGNHDIDEFGAWQTLFGRGNLSFMFRGVRFTLLDSAAASLSPVVYDWLEGWLAAGAGSTHVVGMHIPPLDPVGVRNGSFGSRHEAGKLLARLAEGGVDLTVYGHIHSYYRFDNGSIPAIISGGGGAIPERFDGVQRHFTVLTLGADAGFVDARIVEVD